MSVPRAPRRPAAVIFDMDGLMLDTEPLAARAWADAAAATGVAFDRAVPSSLVGRNYPDCRALILAHHGGDYPVDALMQAWHVAYDAIVERDGIAQKPGLVELLGWLEAARIRKAVATSTRRSRAQEKLARLSLASRFDALVGGDEPARGKPAPDIFTLAAARLEVAAVECVVLEDSEPGIRGAIAAGMTAIWVPDRVPTPPSLAALAPLRFDDLHAVLAHLASLPA